MTLQDYINLVTDSLGNYINFKTSVIESIVAAIVIFALGLIVATLLRTVWSEILKFLNLEKNLAKNSAYSALTKADKTLSLTNFFGSVIWWSAVLVFSLPALNALGVAQVDSSLAAILSYIPMATAGSIYLFFGTVIAWFAYLIVLALGTLVKVSTATTIAKAAAAATMVFSSLLAIKAFGVNEEFLRYIIFGTLIASTVAFGLAGKDLATDILKKVKELVK